MPENTTYACFYKDKQIVVESDTAYHAQLKAAEILKVKDNKRYMISVVLNTKDGKPVTHLPLF